MLAPNLETLHNFEEIFEAATASALAAANVTAIQARSRAEVAVFDVACSFDIGGANETSKRITGIDVNGRNVWEYDRYDNCTLEIQVIGNRFTDAGSLVDDISTQLAEVRAKVRVAMRPANNPLNDSNLKYYRVSRIRPNGTQNGQTENKEREVSTLRFLVDFCIMPDAWPAVETE